MVREDSFIAPAFVIPHIAFQSYMDIPWKMHPSQWRQYPAVPLIFPNTTLHLRAVHLVEPSLSSAPDFLVLAIQGKDSWVARCQAERVGNAVLAVMALDHLMVDPRPYIPVPIPPTLWPNHTVRVFALLEALDDGFTEQSPYGEWHPARLSLMERTVLPGTDWPAATRALVRFFSDPALLRGATYYIASTGVFCFLGDDMTRAAGARDETPPTLLSQADAETAIWLAYKAVEAILGHLPTDRHRLEQRLVLEGFGDFDPGPRGQSAVRLAEELVTFTWDRDKRVAHGSMNQYRRQPITYFEVMDYQYLASALIRHRAFGRP